MGTIHTDCLFKFGEYEFPSIYIVEEGYDTKPNQRQDLDPYTDQTGLTHRNALEHTKTEINITTRPNLTWAEMRSIIDGITSNYINDLERDANCIYWDDEYGVYREGHLYLESSQAFKVKHFRKKYPQITFTFVEY